MMTCDELMTAMMINDEQLAADLGQAFHSALIAGDN